MWPLDLLSNPLLFVLSWALPGWTLRQVDDNNAILHGILHEDVFYAPTTFIWSTISYSCLRLKKALMVLNKHLVHGIKR